MIDMPLNKSMEANRHPPCVPDAEQSFTSTARGPRFLSVAVAHLCRCSDQEVNLMTYYKHETRQKKRTAVASAARRGAVA
jgi:hypothetical protein